MPINNKKGFTLIEMLVTLIVVGILAMIAVPSMIGFMSEGKRVSDYNIARSLYLAAQSRLSEMERDSLLGEFAKEFYDGEDYNDDTKIKTGTKIYDLISNTTIDQANRDYVHYITSNATRSAIPTNTVAELIGDEVLDKDVLINGSISIEFNIKTGIVLGVYYSTFMDSLVYGGGGENDIAVLANRQGTEKIGYYGVEETGAVTLESYVEVFDGTNRPLKYGTEDFEDVLYAQIRIPKILVNGSYSSYDKEMKLKLLPLHGDDFEYDVSFDVPMTIGSLQSKVTSASEEIVFKPQEQKFELNGVDVGGAYDTVVFVLDIFSEGGTNDFNTQTNSISAKYPEAKSDIKVRVSATDETFMAAESVNFAHALFERESTATLGGKTYFINSARHLNNIRNVSEGKFRQIDDVDLRNINMAPLTYKYNEGGNFENTSTPFTGEYIGIKENTEPYKIANLNITSESTAVDDVGLFGHISGGSIKGVYIEKGIVNSQTAKNIGALVGVAENTAISQVAVYANVLSNGTGAVNAGGIAGKMSGSLNISYNGGFYKAATDLDTEDKIGSVIIDGNRGSNIVNIGGLIGENEADIQNAYSNVRVNIIKVDVGTGVSDIYLSKLKQTKKESYAALSSIGDNCSIGGLVGKNLSGAVISSAYATNNVGKNQTEDSLSGALVGKNENVAGNDMATCFFVNNGLKAVGDKTVTKSTHLKKDELSKKDFGAAFVAGGGYAAAFADSISSTYPYPTLKNLLHYTPWEDIKEAKESAILRYYERYEDNSYGYWPNSSEQKELSDNKYVVEEGYLVELPSKQSYNININTAKTDEGGPLRVLNYELTSSGADKWSWPFVGGVAYDMGILPPTEKKRTVDGKEEIYYELIFKHGRFEQRADGAKPIDITIHTLDSEPILEDAYFNPLMPKQIFDNDDIPEKIEIRSPRHLDNIDAGESSLKVNYKQIYHLDFKKYKKDGVLFKMPTGALVKGNKLKYFSGTYDGSGMTIWNFNMPDGKGIFERNEGEIRNIIVESPVLTGDNNIGIIAGINENIIENIIINKATVKSSGGYTGGVVGRTSLAPLRAGNSLVKNCVVRDSYIEETTGKANYTGGIVGSNDYKRSKIEDCKIYNSKIIGGLFVGGITGHNYSGAQTVNVLVSNCEVKGKGMNIGGITGASEGVLDRAAVDATTVSGTTHIGGVVGIASETIKNVYYNFSEDSPQTKNFSPSIEGTKGANTIGGIIGNLGKAEVENVYFSGFMNGGGAAPANYIVGYTSDKSVFKTKNVYYLRTDSYNATQPKNGEIGLSIYDMRRLASKGEGGGAFADLEYWQEGPNATADNANMYIYPVLKDGPITRVYAPTTWAMPDMPTFKIRYYEKYADNAYGFWGGDNSYNSLKDNAQIVEDGYIIQLENIKEDNKYKLKIEGFPENDWSTPLENVSAVLIAGVSDTSLKFIKLPQDYLEKSSAGLSATYICVLDQDDNLLYECYINPLFAKSIFLERPFNLPVPSNDPDRQFEFDTVQAKNHQYIIRTPRHLNNIGFVTLVASTFLEPQHGSFKQELDLDLTAGIYKKVTTVIEQNMVMSEKQEDMIFNEFMVDTISPAGVTIATKFPFTGVYDGNNKSVYNLSVDNTSTTEGTGNVALFRHNHGIIKNLRLSDFKLTARNAAATLAWKNSGTIEKVAVINPTLSGANQNGGIVVENVAETVNSVPQRGKVQDAYVIHNDESLPMADVGTYGGIAAVNNTNISKVLFLSRIGRNPIVGTAGVGSTVSDAYYLYGKGFNDSFTVVSGQGEGKTSAWLTKMDLTTWENWETLPISVYPYPNLKNMPIPPPQALPVDTTTAIAYYEKYTGDKYGYYYLDDGDDKPIDTLLNEPVESAGYVILVPDAITYNVTIGTAPAADILATKHGKRNVAVLNLQAEAEVTLDSTDITLKKRIVHPDFAKGIDVPGGAKRTFIIRTAEQFINIGKVISNHDFKQELDIDFKGTTYTLPIIDTLTGTYNGDNKQIKGLSFDDTADDIALIKNNEGKVQNISVSGVSIKGKDNLGVLVVNNKNAGIIDGCTFSDVNVEGGKNLGVVSATNSGEIKNVTISESRIAGANVIGFAAATHALGIVEKITVAGSVVSCSEKTSPIIGCIVGRNDATVKSCVVNITTTIVGGTASKSTIVGASGNNGVEEECSITQPIILPRFQRPETTAPETTEGTTDNTTKGSDASSIEPSTPPDSGSSDSPATSFTPGSSNESKAPDTSAPPESSAESKPPDSLITVIT